MKSREYKDEAYHWPKNIKDLQRYPLDQAVSLQRRNLPCPRISVEMFCKWSTTETEAKRRPKKLIKASTASSKIQTGLSLQGIT